MKLTELVTRIDDAAYDFDFWNYSDYAETREDGRAQVLADLMTADGRAVVIAGLAGFADVDPDASDDLGELIAAVVKLAPAGVMIQAPDGVHELELRAADHGRTLATVFEIMGGRPVPMGSDYYAAELLPELVYSYQ